MIAVGATLFALSGPGQTAGFSVFVDPVTDTLGVTRQAFTVAYLIATMIAAPVSIWLGRRLDRHPLPSMVRLIGFGLAAALVVASIAPALAVLTIGIVGMRMFGQSGLTLTSTVFVARSITSRRGAALGMLAAVGGAAVTLTPLLASRLIPSIGWRWSWAVFAAITATAAGLLARLPVVERKHGAASPAVSEPVAEQARIDVPRQRSDPHGTPRQRRWGFVVVAAGYGTVAAIATALGFHQIALLSERGLSAGAAAANFVPQSIAAATTAIVVGRVVDRVSGRVIVPVAMAALVLALSAVRLIDGPVTAVLFAMSLGAAMATMTASEGALLARWHGTASLGRLRGRLMVVIVTSSALSPFLLDLLVGGTGSFTTATTVAIALPVAVGAIALLAPLPPDVVVASRPDDAVMSPPGTRRAPEFVQAQLRSRLT